MTFRNLLISVFLTFVLLIIGILSDDIDTTTALLAVGILLCFLNAYAAIYIAVEADRKSRFMLPHGHAPTEPSTGDHWISEKLGHRYFENGAWRE